MKKIWMALMAMIVITSCENNDFENMQQPDGGIKLVLRAEGFSQLNTRATVNENQIDNITILEFQGGTLVKSLYYDNQDFLSAPLTITDGSLVTPLPAATMKQDENNPDREILNENGSENVICVLANLGSTGATGLTEGTSTFADFKALSLAFDKTGTTLPMTGYYYGGITEGVTDQMNVSLTRSVAKINFTLNTTNFKVTTNEGTESPSVTVNSIKLINVPANYSPYACYNRPEVPKNNEAGKWPQTQSPFPAFDATNYASTFTKAENHATDITTGFVAYMPENVRGSYDAEITNPKAKHPGSILNSDDWKTGDSHGYTYILVDLDYTLTNGVIRNAKYKIFLGGDNRGDMNLLRGHQYNITTNIYGANDADSRISVSAVFDPVTGRGGEDNDKVKGNANSYIINPNSAEDIDFVIPLAQVHFGWNAIKDMLSDEHPDKSLDIDAKIIAREITSFTYEWLDYENGPAITFSEPTITFTEAESKMPKYFIKVTVPKNVEAGHNAIIKFNDGTTTLWSWHLWITDYNPDAEIIFKNDTYAYTVTNGQVHRYYGNAFTAGAGKYKEKVMMDRNLGATVTGVTGAIEQPSDNDAAQKYFGLYYQFGRKDPFATTGTNTTAPGTVTYAEATKNPSTFYTVTDGDWNDNGEKTTDYWNSDAGAKSMFDPCPEGWRLPYGGKADNKNVWAGFSEDDTPESIVNGKPGATVFAWQTQKDGQNNTDGRMYVKNDVKAWYPASGNLSRSDASLTNVGVNGFYWSASPCSYLYGYNMSFKEEAVNPSIDSRRATGMPVRCVKE